MAKTKISEFSATPANNTDIDSINIAEGCAPSGINDAIRELMSQLKDFQTGAVGDSFNGPVGTTTAAAGAFTTLAASGAVTLSGGTANGVTYLNGSKVLTSGSALVFDGTNLGIGTSSPNSKLQVNSGTNLGGVLIGFNSGSSNFYDADLQIWRTGNATERMRLDSSGNLGLGVTPSAWNTGGGTKAIQFANNLGTGSLAGWFGSVNLTNNAIFSATGGGTMRYVADGTATHYQQINGGSHAWLTAPSGTAGNAITFTQAMTLDASGNLGVGTTSPQAKLHLSGGSVAMRLGGNGASDWANFGYDGTAYIYTPSTQPILFYTNNTERARIDSSGNLLVGVTTDTGSPNNGVTIRNSTGGTLGNIGIGHATGVGSGNAYMAFAYNSSQIGSITQNGTTGVLYNLTSDYRLKNNPTPVIGSGEFIDALQPKTWDWWDGSGKGVGFIAHEFMEVAKYSGNGEKDAVDAEGKPIYQSIQPSSSEVMANLVAEIQSLRNRLAAAGIA